MRSRLLESIIPLFAIVILSSSLVGFMLHASANQIVLTKIGQVETGDAYDVWVDTESDIAYVSCGYSGVKVFDISDPYEPIELTSVPSSSDFYAHKFAMRQNVMFIGDGRGGLKIVDFEDISTPVVLSQFTGDYAWDVEVAGDLAFVANGFRGVGGKLTIVNITDLTTPTLLGSITTAGDTTDIEIEDDLAFVATSYAGFTVYNISNYTHPIQLAQYTGESTSDTDYGDLEIIGELAFLSYWDMSFKVLNISDISNISVMSEFNESMDAFSVHIDNQRNLAFLCDLELGLLLLDIQNPTQVTEVTRYFDGGKPNRVDIVDSLIYMTDQDNGFVILKIEESNEFIVSLEPLIFIGAVAAIVVLYYWLRYVRVSIASVDDIRP